MALGHSATPSNWPAVLAGDRRLIVGFGLPVALTAAGTIEVMTFVEALYMTVITLSTVGFMEVRPLSDGGRLFTIALIVLGVGTVFYTAEALAGSLIEGKLREVLGRRSMQRSIDSLRDHVILCGYGRLGRAVLERLGAIPVVVIDPDREAALLRPGVIEFLELSDPESSGEVDRGGGAQRGCPVDGAPLRELRERGLEGGDEPIQLRPGPDAVLRGGDRVVAIGDRANLTRLAEAARPE